MVDKSAREKNYSKKQNDNKQKLLSKMLSYLLTAAVMWA